MSIKQQSQFGHLQHNQSYYLAQEHPTDHLLKAAVGQEKHTGVFQIVIHVDMSREKCAFSHLFSRVVGGCVDVLVKLSEVILQGPVISEGPPLSVHTHPALVSLHQVNMAQFLHVACVGART